ncbi:MAG TPA: hypothetical protein VIT21_07930 [Chthoniobacterales bacterium]
MKRFLSIGVFAAALLTAISVIRAQDSATITVQKGAQLNLHVAGISGGDGARVTSVLSNDLKLSDAFSLGGKDTANFIVSGTFSGSQLQGKVVDRSGGTVLAKTYSGDARRAAHQFADDIVETTTGVPGIASTTIAFVATASGKKEIYTADYDGANLRQLTRDGVISVHPSLSRDGRQLLYTGYQSGYADIYRINLASGARNRVAKFPGTNSGGAFSPSGNEFAATLSKDGNPELYIIPAGGGSARRLTRTAGVDSSPSFSPDGGRIVYTSDTSGAPQLYIIPVGGGAGSRLSTQHGYCTEPNWSPDGKKIAFNIRGGSGFQIGIVSPNGSGNRVLSTGNAEDPVWGRDSRHILYASGSALYILDAQSGRQNKVVSGLGKISEPTWSR